MPRISQYLETIQPAFDHWLQFPPPNSDTCRLQKWVSISQEGHSCKDCGQSPFVRGPHLSTFSGLVHLGWFQGGEQSFIYFIRILTNSLKMSISMASNCCEMPHSKERFKVLLKIGFVGGPTEMIWCERRVSHLRKALKPKALIPTSWSMQFFLKHYASYLQALR